MFCKAAQTFDIHRTYKYKYIHTYIYIWSIALGNIVMLEWGIDFSSASETSIMIRGIFLSIVEQRLNQWKEMSYRLYAGVISCMNPANEQCCYIITSSLIGWAHTQNDPCICHVFSHWLSPCSTTDIKQTQINTFSMGYLKRMIKIFYNYVSN